MSTPQKFDIAEIKAAGMTNSVQVGKVIQCCRNGYTQEDAINTVKNLKSAVEIYGLVKTEEN